MNRKGDLTINWTDGRPPSVFSNCSYCNTPLYLQVIMTEEHDCLMTLTVPYTMIDSLLFNEYT